MKLPLVFLSLFFLSVFCGSAFSQTVSSVDFAADGDKVVITYTLTLDRPVDISIFCSTDGGRTFGEALTRITGDVGRDVSAGHKRVVWDVLSELPAGIRGDVVFKVKASPANLSFQVNGVRFEMVYVAGGTFTMGATPEQGDDVPYNEKPAHDVTVSDFYIGKYEVTQAQWEAVMGSNSNLSDFKGSNRPVVEVTWEDIQTFLQRLNAKMGQRYRLPTEAEWEYAARGGNQSRGYKYSGGNDLDSVGWYSQNSGGQTHPVGQKTPNELGLYDMSGNVLEWCQDWYGSYSRSSLIDPTGLSSGSDRVLRGSSWYSDAGHCGVSRRLYGRPNLKSGVIGFRLVSF